MVSARKLTTTILSITAAYDYTATAFTAPLTNERAFRIIIPTTSQLDMFKNAFANDDSLGKKDNPGLKKVSSCCCLFSVAYHF